MANVVYTKMAAQCVKPATIKLNGRQLRQSTCRGEKQKNWQNWVCELQRKFCDFV